MAIKTTKFDVLEHLKTPAEQIAYLEAAVDADDPDFLKTALREIVRARGQGISDDPVAQLAELIQDDSPPDEKRLAEIARLIGQKDDKPL